MQQPDKIETFLWRRAHDGTINSHCEPGLIESCPAGGLFVELFVWSAVYPLVTFPRTHTRCLAEWSLDTTYCLPTPSLHQSHSFLLFIHTNTLWSLHHQYTWKGTSKTTHTECPSPQHPSTETRWPRQIHGRQWRGTSTYVPRILIDWIRYIEPILIDT